MQVVEKLGMQIQSLSDTDHAGWDEFVENHGQCSIFHSSAWKRVLKNTFGYESVFLGAYEEGTIKGILPLYLVPKPFGGQSMVSVPFGVYGGIVADRPETCGELLKSGESVAAQRTVDTLELRQVEKINDELPTKDLYYTFVREIFDGEEKNLTAIPRKQRRMIRQGANHGLRAKIGGREFLQEFYLVYSSSLRNLGTPAFPMKYFSNLFEELKEQCKILTVSYGEKVVAAVMIFFDRERIMPYYGGGLPAYQRFAIYDFMYWEVMRYGWEHGFTVFDFGRSKFDTGPFHFKRHWGFEPQPLPYQYYLPKGGSIPNVNPSNPKLQPFIALWKKLPLVVANRIGPYLIKYLP